MCCGRLRMEAQLKCRALEKDLKATAALNAGRVEYLLAEALLFKTRPETCSAKGWWSMGQCGEFGMLQLVLADCEAVLLDLQALFRFQCMNQALTRSIK